MFGLAVACLVAALPGALILQVLPRLAAAQDSPRAPELGGAALLAPLIGALLGGLLAGGVARGTWRGGALAGACSQLAAVPGYLAVVIPLLEAEFLADVAFFTAILYAYLSLSVLAGAAAAQYAAGRSQMPGPIHAPAALALIAGALALLAAAVSTIGGPAIPWVYAVLLALAAAGHLWPVAVAGTGIFRRTAVPLLIGGLGIAAFAGAAVVRLSLTARP